MGLAIAGALMCLDGFDVVAMALAAPIVMPQFALAGSQMGVVFSALLVGLGVGSALLGPMGDRFGRRPAIIAGMALLAATTLGTATAVSYLQFAAWRFGAGLALGLCLTNATALVAELVSSERRAFAVALASTGMSLGVIIAGTIAPLLIEAGGWQLLFIGPGIATAVLLGLSILALPEPSTTTAAAPARRLASGEILRRLLRSPLRMTLLHFAAMFGASAFAMYWFTNWLPVVLPIAGLPRSEASHLLALTQMVSLAPGVLIAWLVDKGRGRAAFSLCYVVGLAALALFLRVPVQHWTTLVLIAGGAIAGGHLAIASMAARRFPSETLSSAIGIGIAMTRIGAVGGSMAGGLLLDAGIAPAAFLAALALPVLGCMGLAQWSPQSSEMPE
jgi:AAHS family 4-hydroxybenzoate transporter-like MFS transporter